MRIILILMLLSLSNCSTYKHDDATAGHLVRILTQIYGGK